MIDLFTWSTPNGRKVSIMLEEIGLDYEVHAINITKGEQHDPKFLEIAPNNKIPVIVDRDNGLSLMESGAILQYLARKSGQFLPATDTDFWKMQEWLMFQMASVGPMFGQVHTFVRYGESKNVEASERYLKECHRLYGVMDNHLSDRNYFLGVNYSIVDIAIFPWIGRHDWQTVNLNDYPNVAKWYVDLAGRPAVQRGWNVPENDQVMPMP
ncbi:MAG: Disulfide-bond oxidoreductase YfcG [Alphaproteobacteria bacterium MarineAlpha3_Bin6]|nr:MAG: Disulfide-bond oxidoreductase YfcG [Alphaproteobacteria bacterium MarineAlpha3_Bin6]HIN76157.1 glutathione S-transferase family protein [Rhodospirillales bacterium]HIO50772.1 glutathione S-transferase family protein [Candidatus Poribacteria bacterium]